MDRESQKKIDAALEKLHKKFPKRPAPSPFVKINKEWKQDQENERRQDAYWEFETD